MSTPIEMSREDLETLLEVAAERGAKKALVQVGLHDEDAMGDLRDLRGLLAAYKTVKTSILTTVGKAIAVAVIAALAFKYGINWKVD
jgi:hypothetical protein